MVVGGIHGDTSISRETSGPRQPCNLYTSRFTVIESISIVSQYSSQSIPIYTGLHKIGITEYLASICLIQSLFVVPPAFFPKHAYLHLHHT